MLERASLTSPATLSEEAVRGISQALMPLLCDVFALYLKTKNSIGTYLGRISGTIT
jgi:hypothetical protein